MEENKKTFDVKIMKPIDELVMTQLEKVKELPQYQKVQDSYNLLEDGQQTIANIVIMIFTVSIPVLITIIFFIIYSSKSSQLDQAEKTINSASSIISKSNQIREKKSKVFGPTISTEGQLRSRINSSLSGSGIDSSKIIITNFDLFDTAGVNEISATIQFKELSNSNVFALINTLFIRNKFKAKNINREKNLKAQLVNCS